MTAFSEYTHMTEQALLGGCIIDGIAPQIEPEHFYREAHRVIASTIQALKTTGRAIDAITLFDELSRSGKIEMVGGASYLAGLMDFVPGARNVHAYQRIVSQAFHERTLLVQSQSLQVMAGERRAPDVARHIEDMRCTIHQICDSGKPSGNVADLKQILMDLEDPARQGQMLGLSTGLLEYDKKTSGLCASDLIIIAGRPGMGKTSLAVNMALNIARRGEKVQFFSLEMSREQLLYRMIADLAQVDLLELRSGNLSEVDKARAIKAVGDIMSLPILIDDTPRLTELEICARASNAAPAVVFVDYLGYVRCSRKVDRKDLEIGEVTAAFKALAKSMHIPVVVLSQLNRKLEERTDKRPVMSDLRDSGSIEQDADVIVFLYVDQKYNESSEIAGIAELGIGKQRNGPTGVVPVAFREQFTAFRNLDPASIGQFYAFRNKKGGKGGRR